ncbi:MAG TPA: protein-glutamate O-methyltransferase CheR [Desulfuromonadales bacterium]|nr:protein-glutamate O-methyltransferase CheR [Desulfuromonadales bacterium]
MMHLLSGHSLVDSLEISDDALTEISRVLNMRRGFSMSIYKDNCMKRRIAIRMRSCRCSDAAEYCTLLQQSEQELDHLKKTLTIHVSHFFRNPSMFAKLQTGILPSLFQKAIAERKKLRCYSLGCAGGEEAYTVAMILREYYSRQLLHTPVEIAAYDIDSDILQTAVRAEYTEDRLKDLPHSFGERYFVPEGKRLQLTAEIRNMVSFHQHNLMDVETLDPCQLVLCRNTLIYFTRHDQEKIVRGIADILPTGGILVLGKSETVTAGVRHLFAAICPVERIYRRL